MAGGRPSKYNISEEIHEDKVKDIFNTVNHFKNEREMCDFIEQNIKLFCKELFDDEYIKHKREYSFENGWWSRKGSVVKEGKHNTRIDFMVTCKRKNYAVEVKNPKQKYTELSRSIGQLMMYQMVMEWKGIDAEIVLVSSSHVSVITQMIHRYNLGYRYFVFNKDYSAEYKTIPEKQVG